MITSPMTDEQVARLGAALASATAHPESHDQGAWLTLERVDRATGLSDPHRHRGEWMAEAEDSPRDEKLISIEEITTANGMVVLECGTAGCLAGHALIQHNRTAVFKLDSDGEITDVIDDDGEPVSISRYARNLFGLGDWAADALFSPVRSIAELWIMAEILTGGRLIMPGDLVDNPRYLDPLDGERITAEHVEAARRRWTREIHFHGREVFGS